MKKRLLIAALVITLFSFVYGENDYKRKAGAAGATGRQTEQVWENLPAQASGLIEKD